MKTPASAEETRRRLNQSDLVSRVRGVFPVEIDRRLILVHLVQCTLVDHVVDICKVGTVRSLGGRDRVVWGKIVVTQGFLHIHVGVARIVGTQEARRSQKFVDTTGTSTRLAMATAMVTMM